MLIGCLALMAVMIVFALFFPAGFTALLKQPALYGHALFVHTTAVTLFFFNAVLGMIWERRILASAARRRSSTPTGPWPGWMPACQNDRADYRPSHHQQVRFMPSRDPRWTPCVIPAIS